MISRYAVTGLAAAVITFGLFYIMQELIAKSGDREAKTQKVTVIEFSRTRADTDTQTRERKLPEKVEQEKEPEAPEIDLTNIPKPSGDGIGKMGIGVIVSQVKLSGGPSLGAPTDGEEVPLVRIEPRYPPRALSRGIEGWVQLEFTVSETGAVVDPVVIDAEPSSIFNSSAVRAVERWKYKPKVVDGVAVPRKGVQVVLTFKIADDKRG